MNPLGPTVQVMPGPGKSFAAFQSDQSTCKTFAADQTKGQADAVNQRAAGAAVLTTLLGAGLGAAIGGASGNAGAGAAIGSAAGAGTGGAFAADGSSSDQYNIQVQYDNAYSQCMFANGEQVPGFAPVAVADVSTRAAAVPDPMVRSTQAELIRLGYYNGTADGFSGPRTRAAVAAFERSRGLPADSSASPHLLAMLQSTPTVSAVAAATPPQSSGWVAPTSSAAAATPVTASAPAGSNWVAPAATKTP